MPRYFTRDGALQMLPRIERLLREAIHFKGELQQVDHDLKLVTQRINTMGGVQVRHREVLDLRARREASISSLKSLVERIHDTGCQVKDLDMGLVDFPTLYQEEEVLLCWKLGESGIEYWHGLEEGFRGRKPIDAEFLNNHRGGEE
jgi:hypothetical protein